MSHFKGKPVKVRKARKSKKKSTREGPTKAQKRNLLRWKSEVRGL
jgi:hypothetical protein